MKKHIYLSSLVIAGAFLLGACSYDDIETISETAEGEGVKVVFTAGAGDDGGTRTALDKNNGVSVNWSAHDSFTVFDTYGNSAIAEIQEGVGENVGEFLAEFDRGGQQPWYAVYPTTDQLLEFPKVPKGVDTSAPILKNIKMPAFQNAVTNGFDPKSNLMTAYSNDIHMNFKQVVCYVQIDVDAFCTGIDILANDGELLAGTINLTLNKDGISSYVPDPVACTSRVRLLPGDGSYPFKPVDGVKLIAPGKYYIGILPQVLKKGFTVKVYTANNEVFYKSYNKETSAFGRDKIVALGHTKGWNKHVCDHNYVPGKGKEEAGEGVDLGLTKKWSSVNLGAVHPWEYGDYYQWGATTPLLESYDMHRDAETGIYNPSKDREGIASVSPYCKWKETLRHEQLHYLPENSPYYENGTASDLKSVTYRKYNKTDGLIQLDQANDNPHECDDAADFQWGDGWEMPTADDFYELYTSTYWEWTDNFVDPDIGETHIKGVVFYMVIDEEYKGWHCYLPGKLKPSPTGDSKLDYLYDKNVRTDEHPMGLVKPDENGKVGGVLVIDRNTHIFLPASGGIATTSSEAQIRSSNFNGYTWTKDRVGSYESRAWLAGFATSSDQGYPKMDSRNSAIYRCYGYPIRPVRRMPK